MSTEITSKTVITEVMRITGKGILGVKTRKYYIFDKAGQGWRQTAPLLNSELVLVPEEDGTHFLKWCGREKVGADDVIEEDDYIIFGYPGGRVMKWEEACAKFA